MGAFNSLTSASLLANSASSVGGRLNGNGISGSITGGTGLFSISKTSSTVTNVYKNGTSVGSGNSGGTLASSEIYLGTGNISGIPYNVGYVNSQFAFAYMCDGLSGTDVANLYTAVQAFQVALARNI
jgi:hydrogenase maturation factor HypE